MMRSRRAAPLAAVVALALFCASCATPPPAPSAAPATPAPVEPSPPPPPTPPPPPITASSELDLGVKSFEDGDYKAATSYLRHALDMGLPTPQDVARAHKYLAFMVCVNGREKVCRDEFKAALEADPAFALAPAEAGHPVWSQVVRSVKAEIANAQKKKK